MFPSRRLAAGTKASPPSSPLLLSRTFSRTRKLSSLVSLTCIATFHGAYTGVCSQQHVPSYKNNIDKFKAKGIDSVICVAADDPYVLNGWAEKLQAKDAVSHSPKSHTLISIFQHMVSFMSLFLF